MPDVQQVESALKAESSSHGDDTLAESMCLDWSRSKSDLSQESVEHPLSMQSDKEPDEQESNYNSQEEVPSSVSQSLDQVFDADEASDREIITVAFGPRGSWFVRWSDGMTAWYTILSQLLSKKGRTSA